jgi:hypothetical protein
MTTAATSFQIPDALPAGFGDGWLSKNARDTMRIAIMFGGFDRDELIRRVAMAGSDRTTNAGTVGRILDEMTAEWDDANA